MCFDYQNIEKLLTQLLQSVAEDFSETEEREVQEFIDAGEYGIALETFTGIVEEEKKVISEDVIVLVREAAVAMQMRESVFDAKLLSRVIDR